MLGSGKLVNSLGSPVSCSPSSHNWKGPALPVGPGTAHTILTVAFTRSCCNDMVSSRWTPMRAISVDSLYCSSAVAHCHQVYISLYVHLLVGTLQLQVVLLSSHMNLAAAFYPYGET